MKIGKFQLGVNSPFVIAEMSGNHNQSLQRAMEIVEAAAKAGAHALKLQTYTADTITLDVHHEDFVINDQTSLWKGKNLHQLYQEAHTPWDWHGPIMERATELGMVCFSSPFDESAVDFLESLDVPAYKIASFENCHLPLIRRAAATGKPLIVSTGMATISEIDTAVRCARQAGCRDLVLLKCTSTYPASPSNSNIRTIPHLKELFGCHVGISDHTLGIGVALAAIALGATVIEKHFTLARADGGVDSTFSLEPHELQSLVEESQRAFAALGNISYGPTEAEKKSLAFRRSLYVAQDIARGDILTLANIRCVRPGFGLEPKYLDIVLGKRVSMDIVTGTPLGWHHLLSS